MFRSGAIACGYTNKLRLAQYETLEKTIWLFEHTIHLKSDKKILFRDKCEALVSSFEQVVNGQRLTVSMVERVVGHTLQE